jgi:Kef-type K+ transport system membrane component KefB
VNQWLVASVWMALALAAGLISVRTAISVSLLEIAMGVIGGNVFHLHTTDWTNFLAGFGAILLTFMAGAEIDPDSLRKHLKPSLAIGGASFLLPFAAAWAFARLAAHWEPRAALIAACALSDTSVAVVYVVMLETRLNGTSLGKLILASCFMTGLGTMLALGTLFSRYDWRLAAAGVVCAAALFLSPRVARGLFRRLGGRVSELEIKFLLLLLFALGGLASQANSEPVLPAYLLGLVFASLFAEHKDLVRRLRTVALGLLTPFYFLKAGLFVALPVVGASAGLIAALLAVKVMAKCAGVWPLTRAFRLAPGEGAYMTLLMSTGLTFGTISALSGLTRHIITQSQYTVLVTVVIGSAVIPTLIAQAFFRPAAETASAAETALPHLTEAPEHVA